MKKIVRNIPNMFTLLRLILIPFILGFAFHGKLKISVLLICIAAITDFLDGFIARTFHLVSELGAKLDMIADKFFAGSLIICLIIKNKLFILCLVGELLIAITNTMSYLKKQNPKTKYIGKIKTTLLFITIIIAVASEINHKINFLVNPFIYITFGLQIIALICYLSYTIFYKAKKKAH